MRAAILCCVLGLAACGEPGAVPADLSPDLTDEDGTFSEWQLAPEEDGGVEQDLAIDDGDLGATGDLRGAADLRSPTDFATTNDLAPPPTAGLPATRLIAHQKGSNTSPSGYYSYVPPTYPGGTKWPLLVALHGVGENGNQTSELYKVVNVGIGKLIKANTWPNTRPFIVLMPQHTGVNNCPNATEVKNFINWAMVNYQVDPKRVYLTGLSCGAYGGWAYVASELDNKVAAFVPIAGNGSSAWSTKGCLLGKLAIWGFHGDADTKVNVSGTNVPMDGLAGCPVPPRRETKKTIYPGVNHDSWTKTYDGTAGHDIYSWLLGIQHL